jgi:hypothetical protein
VAALHQAINALGVDWLTRWESLATREQRTTARVELLTNACQELKELTALTQQSTLSLKRAVQQASAGVATGETTQPAPAAGSGAPTAGPTRMPMRTSGSKIDSADPRGHPPTSASVPSAFLMAPPTSSTSDAGAASCWISFANAASAPEASISTKKWSPSAAIAAFTRIEPTWSGFSRARRMVPWVGLIATQVVEHLKPDYLMRFLETAHQKLAPGATLVLETINPACWTAFFDAYIRDLTHAQPLHPDTLKYLVQAAGYQSVQIQFLSPVADAEKLPTVHADPASYDQQPALDRAGRRRQRARRSPECPPLLVP